MASPARPSAEEVGDAFQKQYYDHLQNSPEILSLYYKDNSKISRPGLDGTMRASTLLDMIEDLDMLSSGGFDSVEVTSFMSQDSHGGGVLVVVDGYVTLNATPARNFTQTFFLAPQEPGYFVLTDMFKFVDIRPEANAIISPANNVSKPSYASVVMKGIPIGQGQHSSSCDRSPVIKADAVDDSRNGNSQESQVSEGACIYVTWLPQNATIALVENAFKQFGKIRRGGVEVRSKTNYKYAFVEFEEADAAKRAIMAAPIMFDGSTTYVEKKRPYNKNIKADAGDDTGRNSQESQGVTEGAGIFVKKLPPNATIALVKNVFKQFGPIKKGGIRVRNPPASNYWYGFVEFEEADAAKRAIKASPLSIDGHTTHVEKKLPYYKESGYFESPSVGPGNIYRSEELKGTEGVGMEEEEEDNQNWDNTIKTGIEASKGKK